MRNPFVLDNCEQLDITPAQAKALEAADLIYRPEPEYSDDYFTTVPDITLDDVERALREPTGEPYHDGTSPFSRYETDSPADFRRAEKLREAQDFLADA